MAHGDFEINEHFEHSKPLAIDEFGDTPNSSMSQKVAKAMAS